MTKKDYSGGNIKTPVKKLSKQITQKYIQGIVKEIVKRIIKKQSENLPAKKTIKLEEKLKKLPDKEKIKHFEKSIEEISENISQTGINEGEIIERMRTIEKIFEKRISSLLFPSTIEIVVSAVIIISAATGIALVLSGQPVASIESISTELAFEGQPIQFTGKGMPDNPDDSIKAYRWESDIDGFLSNSRTFTTRRLSEGVHEISFRVRDNNGEWSDVVTANIEILPGNNPPIAIIAGIEPGTLVEEGTPMVFSGSGTNPDENDFITAFEWFIDGTLSSNEKEFTRADLPVGNHLIELRVRDNLGLWSDRVSASIEVFQENNPPVAVIENIRPGLSVEEGTPLIFSGNGSDPDEVDFILEYEWLIDGKTLSKEKEFFNGSLKAGTRKIQFRVRDNHKKWSEPVFETINIRESLRFVVYKVYQEKELIVEDGLCSNGEKNCVFEDLREVDGGEYYSMVGDRIALNGSRTKLAALVLEQDVGNSKALGVNESWEIEGWKLFVMVIDPQGFGVRFALLYDGVMVDEKWVMEGDMFAYSEQNIAGEFNVPMFVTYVDSVFVGQSTSLVELKYTWAVSRDVEVVE